MPVKQAGSRDADLLDRFEVVVDQDAEPADFDEAIAEFLLKIVERRLAARRQTISGGTPAAAVDLATGDKGRQ